VRRACSIDGAGGPDDRGGAYALDVRAATRAPSATTLIAKAVVAGLVPRGESSVAIGFVLISTAPAKEHEVYTELLRVKGIVELHPLFGEYDLIAKVEAEDFNALGQLVVDKIRSVPGVIDTKTLTGIKF
jgi:DNA-binding Lrp family transcriptional regulator